jgi:hypothetical protein
VHSNERDGPCKSPVHHLFARRRGPRGERREVLQGAGSPAVPNPLTIQADDTGGGVADLRLYHNGARVQASQAPSVEGRITRQVIEVDLVPGTNQFVARARNAEGQEASSERQTIRFSMP